MSIIQDFIDLLFPSDCVVCDSRNVSKSVVICESCFSEVKPILERQCRCCGMVFPVQNDLASYLCGSCIKHNPSFDVAKSLFWYEAVVKDLLIRIKFHSDTPSLSGLKTLLTKVDLSFYNDCDLIIPVPLHHKRLRRRGFNQALLLSRLLFPDRLKDIKPFLLLRRGMTRPQTGLSGAERRKNLKNVFTVNNPDEIRSLKICLVDDVYTTGTTVDECSRVLKACGCESVMVLTVARVVAV